MGDAEYLAAFHQLLIPVAYEVSLQPSCKPLY